jgi:hypothetical protein
MIGKERKPGGGKLTRSETVTVRFDPKLRYLAEIAGRMHRRTLSSFVEWATQSEVRANLGDLAEALWDTDEQIRFEKLALIMPHLLTYDEQVRRKKAEKL